MDNNQFDATTFIPVVGLLTGGSQTQAKTLEIEFKGETVSKWTFSENNKQNEYRSDSITHLQPGIIYENICRYHTRYRCIFAEWL
jgi:hypothetical protein